MNAMSCLPYESMAPENFLVLKSEDLAECLETYALERVGLMSSMSCAFHIVIFISLCGVLDEL